MRDQRGAPQYWSKWVAWLQANIDQNRRNAALPGGNAEYRPQYLFGIARTCWESMLCGYSAGLPITELGARFEDLLSAWEQSEELGKPIFTPEQQRTRNGWAVNLDHYIVCFWLTGLALALDIPDERWQRLVALMGNEGEDELLDGVIATRQPGRRIGTTLCHPQPYARLLAAVQAEAPAERSALLRDFVEHWYRELDRKATRGRPAIYNRPYWYRFGDENFEGGAYFGRWCVEAVAVAKAFGIDDTPCLGHPHYPGDLLRPDGPSTHPRMHEADAPDAPPMPAPGQRPAPASRPGAAAPAGQAEADDRGAPVASPRRRTWLDRVLGRDRP